MAKLKGEVYCPLCTDGKGNAKKVATVKADTKAELDQKANAARREHHARVHPNWPGLVAGADLRRSTIESHMSTGR